MLGTPRRDLLAYGYHMGYPPLATPSGVGFRPRRWPSFGWPARRLGSGRSARTSSATPPTQEPTVAVPGLWTRSTEMVSWELTNRGVVRWS